MDHLYAGWRTAQPPDKGADGVSYPSVKPAPGKTLFETIDQADLDDSETYVITRTEHSFVVLNVYPYTSGHLMVLPRLAAASIVDLDPVRYRDLWDTVRAGVQAVNQAFGPDGINIGINEGVAGGGSQPDHLHVHVVPRWSSDTNFMTSVAEARILPVTLTECWERLRKAWPGLDGESVGI